MPSAGGAESAQDAFAEEVASLARDYLGASVEQGPDFTLQVTKPGETKPIIVHLGNIYAQTEPLTEQARRGFLLRTVMAMAPPPLPTTWEEAAPLLMPAVRPTSWGRPRPDAKDVLAEPLAPHLDVSIAIDAIYAMTYVTVDHPAEWGVDLATLREQATSNLTGKDLALARIEDAFLVTGPDDYQSSWLAVPDVLRQITAHVAPETLAFVPSREHLRLVDAANTEAVLSSIERITTDWETDSRRLSPVPYLITDGQITPWQPPGDHPAAEAANRARLLLDSDEYQRQKEFLEEGVGEDMAVANLGLATAPAGRRFSWAVWSKNATALLPRVDRLILVGDAGPIDGTLPWEAAMAIAGAYLVEEPGCRPPRWRHQGWPPPEILRALQERLEPPANG